MRHQFYESVVTVDVGKLVLERLFDVKGMEHFELSISALMEEHEDRHELRKRYFGLAFYGVGMLPNHLLIENWLKFFAKVIDFAENFGDGDIVHGKHFL